VFVYNSHIIVVMCLCNVNIQVLVNELWDKILKSSARKLSKCVPDNVQVYIETKFFCNIN